MAMKTRYTVVDGEVIAEKRSGVRHEYVPDPLGSTVALLDNTQTQTDTFVYWPYGEEASRTGTTPAPFRFVGTAGYYRDTINRIYVRARHLAINQAHWISLDAFWPYESAYGYARNNPLGYIDVSGNQTGPPDNEGRDRENRNIKNEGDLTARCNTCAIRTIQAWWRDDHHKCNHAYIHCLTCCTLARTVGAECARSAQQWQNRLPFTNKGTAIASDRMSHCEEGITLAPIPCGWTTRQTTQCHDHCITKHPPEQSPNINTPECRGKIPYLRQRLPNPCEGMSV